MTHQAPVESQGRRPDGRVSVGSRGRCKPRKGLGPVSCLEVGSVWGPQLRVLWALGDWAGRGGSRMVTSLAASGGPLTPWAGKEAGAWGGPRGWGAGAHPLPGRSLGSCGWGLGESGQAQGGRRPPCDLLVGLGGRDKFISDSRAMILENWNHTVAECPSSGRNPGPRPQGQLP